MDFFRKSYLIEVQPILSSHSLITQTLSSFLKWSLYKGASNIKGADLKMTEKEIFFSYLKLLVISIKALKLSYQPKKVR